MSTVLPSTSSNRDPYMELICQFPLRHIRNDDELSHAIAVIDGLLDKQYLESGEEEYLDVLSDLVHSYESTEHPICSASDAEVLRHLMDSNELKQKDLAQKTGIAVSVISEILAGKRSLNRKQVALVAKTFNVNPGVFFG